MLTKLKLQYILLLMVLGIAQISYCCDMSAFDQSDFAERCQRLIDYTNKAYIAIAVQHPDTDKRLSEVSKDWIDFYLSHGNRGVQPPNMSFISPEIWERNIKALGTHFEKFLRKKATTKSYQSIVLELSLFKSNEQLSQLHNCFKVSEICETDLNKIDNLDLWLEARLLTPCSLIYDYEKEFPELISDLNCKVEVHLDEIKSLKENIKSGKYTKEALQNLFDIIKNNIKKNLNTWEMQYFYK